MVTAAELAWQNRTIAATSDFRGILMLGLLAAWFYFVWQWLSLPPLAAVEAGLPPLLRSALAKGAYMPDFGMILAGFAGFHFRRELRRELSARGVWRVYLSTIVPLIAYLGVGTALLEVVHLAGPAHALVLPWQDARMAVTFVVLTTAIVLGGLWPFLLYAMWTVIFDIGFAGLLLGLIYNGMVFTVGAHRLLWMWPSNAIVDFLVGACLCGTLFRGITYFAPVRGATIILGWMSLLAGAIQSGPSLFFLGFVMVAAGCALGERTWFLPGEKTLLIWSRMALALVLVQPAVLTAWLIWGAPLAGMGWRPMLVMAAVTQLVATLLFMAIETSTRRLAAPMVDAAA